MGRGILPSDLVRFNDASIVVCEADVRSRRPLFRKRAAVGRGIRGTVGRSSALEVIVTLKRL